MPPCQTCGRPNAADARFCSGCGTRLDVGPQARREERKVVSVLFADLVSFTSRSERLDPEDVRGLLSPYYARLRTDLERHGGTVEKFIGDAVMALFGAPTAHEDDPERAVRAALAIRDWIVDRRPELQVRIGVATGEALVALEARPADGEGMAAGDVVNTAARLQAGAPVNGILVSERTYLATRDAIIYDDARSVNARGKAEPVRVWEARAARAPSAATEAATPLVGRRRELGLLADALTRSHEDHRTQLVTLVGVPGIGKSRLVAELAARADAAAQPVTWRLGRSLPYGEGVTYWALGEIVKAHCGILERDAVDAVAGKLHHAVTSVLSDDDAEAAAVERALRPLVGLDGDLQADAAPHGTWRRFFEALADDRPLVLVVEDLHWADDGLLDFLDHLVDWATGVPLLVVCTARPEFLERRPAWGGGKLNALTVSLAPLSDADTAELIGFLASRSALAGGGEAGLLSRVGGNPLYTEQFVRMLLEGGAVGAGVPEGVHGIIAARLDALDGQDKTLLHAASVIGEVFWRGAAAAVAGHEVGTTEARLHALERKGFVRRARRSSVAEEAEHAFQHVLVRDVAYGQLPRAARARMHRLAGDWIASLGGTADHAEMVAHHYVRATEYARSSGQPSIELEALAWRALRDAGDRALALNALPTAARYFEAALGRCPREDPERPALLLRVGRSRPDDPTLDDSLLESASASLLAGGDLDGAAEAQAMLACNWWVRGSKDRVREHMARATKLVTAQTAAPTRVQVLSTLARLAMLAGDSRAAIASATEALAAAEELGRPDITARIVLTIGAARAATGDPAGVRDIERGIEQAAAARLSHLHWKGLVNLCSVALDLGDCRWARALHEESLGVADGAANAADLAWDRAERVVHCYHGGEWAEAEALLEDFLHGPGAAGHYMETAVRDVRSRLRRARGDLAGALEDTSRELERARDIEDPQALHPALAAHADLLSVTGRTEEADRLLSELIAAWRRQAWVHGTGAPADAAWALERMGRPEKLLAMIDPRPGPSRWAAAAGAILRGDFLAAADRFARIGSLPDEAYARLRAAEGLIADGRRAEADEQLQRARRFWSSVQATAYVEACDAAQPLQRRTTTSRTGPGGGAARYCG